MGFVKVANSAIHIWLFASSAIYIWSNGCRPLKLLQIDWLKNIHGNFERKLLECKLLDLTRSKQNLRYLASTRNRGCNLSPSW